MIYLISDLSSKLKDGVQLFELGGRPLSDDEMKLDLSSHF